MKSKPLTWAGNRAAQAVCDVAYAKLKSSQQVKSGKQTGTKIAYGTYMQSKKWRRKRAKAIRRAGGICEICHKADNLHVHHKTYSRLGRERPEDLQVLCAGCHGNVHEGNVLGVLDPITDEYLTLNFL